MILATPESDQNRPRDRQGYNMSSRSQNTQGFGNGTIMPPMQQQQRLQQQQEEYILTAAAATANKTTATTATTAGTACPPFTFDFSISKSFQGEASWRPRNAPRILLVGLISLICCKTLLCRRRETKFFRHKIIGFLLPIGTIVDRLLQGRSIHQGTVGMIISLSI